MTNKNVQLTGVKSSKAAFANRSFVGPYTPSLRLAWAICYAVRLPTGGDEVSGNYETNVELIESWCRKNRHRHTSAAMGQREQILRLAKAFRGTEIFIDHKMYQARLLAKKLKNEMDAQAQEAK